jgi:hypothetical protein
MNENVKPDAGKRLLALEIRSRKIGFVVFDTPTRLLDWGTSSSCSHPTRDLHEVVTKIVRSLFHRYRPCAVVMRRPGSFSSKNRMRFRISAGAIKRESDRHGVQFRFLKTKPRKQFFVQLRCRTKHEVEQLISDLFEELSWNVPSKRKPWHSESYSTVMFDAAATGLFAFADEFSPDGVRKLIAAAESFHRPLDGAAR